MEKLIEYLPFLIPVILIELALIITALLHIHKHPSPRLGNKVMWIVIVVCIQIIGPIIYFVYGRGEE